MSLVSMILFGIATTVFVVGCCAMFLVYKHESKKSVEVAEEIGGWVLIILLISIVLSGIAGGLWIGKVQELNTNRIIDQFQQANNCIAIDYSSRTMLWTTNNSLHYSIKTRCDGCEDGYMWVDYILGDER